MTAEQMTTSYLARHGHMACTSCGHEWRTVVVVVGLLRRCPGCNEYVNAAEVAGCECSDR